MIFVEETQYNIILSELAQCHPLIIDSDRALSLEMLIFLEEVQMHLLSLSGTHHLPTVDNNYPGLEVIKHFSFST